MLRTAMPHIDKFISKLSRRTILISVLLFIFLLGILDFDSGFETTFSFFYLIPIAIATWYLGKTEGRIMVVLSIITWAVSNRLAGEVYSQEIIRYWNAGIRLIVFILFAELLYGLKLALLHEQALSRTDFLTGIYNSREFYERADLEILRARRNGNPMTVAYMDLDSFKQVNDRHGHREGDKLLKIIAQTASSVIRKTDIVARLGGDEFVFLFPDSDQTKARVALEKVKLALVNKMRESNLPITFSIGAVTFLSAPQSTDEMLHQADKLMYEVKESGKNEIAYLTLEN
jgi:diguanylate cyclase (GGDEF)-like protein